MLSVEVTLVSVGEASGVVRLTVCASKEVETHEAAGSIGVVVIKGVGCEVVVVVASLVGIAGVEVFVTASPSLKSPVGILCMFCVAPSVSEKQRAAAIIPNILPEVLGLVGGWGCSTSRSLYSPSPRDLVDDPPSSLLVDAE